MVVSSQEGGGVGHRSSRDAGARQNGELLCSQSLQDSGWESVERLGMGCGDVSYYSKINIWNVGIKIISSKRQPDTNGIVRRNPSDP